MSERRPKLTEQTSPTQVKSGVGTEEKGFAPSLNNLFARDHDKILDGVVTHLRVLKRFGVQTVGKTIA